MKTTALELREIVDEILPKLSSINPATAAHKNSPASWSKKEILGHLIDSAVNNHQRFVRAGYNAAAGFPPYDQLEWVQIQQHQQTDWETLIEAWAVFNRYLSLVIARMPAEALAAPVNIGQPEPVTLEFVVQDYLRHLRHHLADILG